MCDFELSRSLEVFLFWDMLSLEIFVKDLSAFLCLLYRGIGNDNYTRVKEGKYTIMRKGSQNMKETREKGRKGI